MPLLAHLFYLKVAHTGQKGSLGNGGTRAVMGECVVGPDLHLFFFLPPSTTSEPVDLNPGMMSGVAMINGAPHDRLLAVPRVPSLPSLSLLSSCLVGDERKRERRERFPRTQHNKETPIITTLMGGPYEGQLLPM